MAPNILWHQIRINAIEYVFVQYIDYVDAISI